ncbi:MAG: hypothetical protein ACOC44_05275 [Promethearchaeia archaeon]
MPCKHGLNASICPVCRIENSTSPEISSKVQNPAIDLRPQGRRLKKHLEQKKEYEKRITSSPNYKRLNITDLRPNTCFINGLPDFRTQAFKERLEDIKLGNMDKFGITKKVKITSPELDPEKTKEKY